LIIERNPDVLTSLIVRDIHNQQVREMERALLNSKRRAAADRFGLRQRVGRGLIRVGFALAAENSRQQATPC
jgi:hypothetical protein